MDLNTAGGKVAYKDTIKTMGIQFCPSGQAQDQRKMMDSKVEDFVKRMDRLRRVPTGWEDRNRMTGALMTTITFGAAAGNPTDKMVHKATRAATEAMAGGKRNNRRCAEMATGMLSPVHRCNLEVALAFQRAMMIPQIIGLGKQAKEVLKEAWERQQKEGVIQGGFIQRVTEDFHKIGWNWVQWNLFQDETGKKYRLQQGQWSDKLKKWGEETVAMTTERVKDLRDMAKKHTKERKKDNVNWQHAMRSAWRRLLATRAGRRRRDMEGLGEDCKDAVQGGLQSLEQEKRPRARGILMGAIVTRARLRRTGTAGESGMCPLGCTAQDTEEHRFWQCPHVEHIRGKELEDKRQWCGGKWDELPGVAKTCLVPALEGLPTADEKEWRTIWPRILNMGCDITEAFTEDWKATRREDRKNRREVKKKERPGRTLEEDGGDGESR